VCKVVVFVHACATNVHEFVISVHAGDLPACADGSSSCSGTVDVHEFVVPVSMPLISMRVVMTSSRTDVTSSCTGDVSSRTYVSSSRTDASSSRTDVTSLREFMDPIGKPLILRIPESVILTHGCDNLTHGCHNLAHPCDERARRRQRLGPVCRVPRMDETNLCADATTQRLGNTDKRVDGITTRADVLLLR
jgi:hypothetical protein